MTTGTRLRNCTHCMISICNTHHDNSSISNLSKYMILIIKMRQSVSRDIAGSSWCCTGIFDKKNNHKLIIRCCDSSNNRRQNYKEFIIVRNFTQPGDYLSRYLMSSRNNTRATETWETNLSKPLLSLLSGIPMIPEPLEVEHYIFLNPSIPRKFPTVRDRPIPKPKPRKRLRQRSSTSELHLKSRNVSILPPWTGRFGRVR